MRRRKDSDIYDRIAMGALLMLAAEILGPVPLIGAVIELIGFVL